MKNENRSTNWGASYLPIIKFTIITPQALSTDRFSYRFYGAGRHYSEAQPFLSYAGHTVVLEPAPLRERVLNELKKAVKNYEEK